MSVSKTNSASKVSAPKKADKPKVDNKAKAPAKPKDAKAPDKKDGFSPSKELADNKKPGEAKDAKDAKNAKDAKDPNKPGDAKDPNKPEEGKDPAKDDLLSKVSDLQKQLDDMKNKKEEKPPENLGGCCGKSHDAQKAEDPAQKQDPDSELTQLAVAVMQGGGQQPGQANPTGKPGEAGKTGQVGAVNGAKGAGAKPTGTPAQLKAQLSEKYQQYKTQGVQLRKETEQLVESALAGGGAPGQTQQPGQPPQANGTHNNNQAKPLTKA